MSRNQSWLDRTLNSMSATLDEWGALVQTRAFWGVVAVGATVVGFLITAFIMLTNFDVMRMRSCFNASNLSAYLMFNTLLFFILAGLVAVGEVFNYFDNKRRGIPHNRAFIFGFLIVTSTLGTAELILIKMSC